MSVAAFSLLTQALRRYRLSRRRARRLGAVLFLVLLGVEMAVLSGAWQRPRLAAPTTGAGVDPRLVVRAHTVALAGALAGGVTLSGTLYPALPGLNTLRLALRGTQGMPPVGSLHLVVTMPGMAMTPIRAALAVRAGRYSGTVLLPMFGRYRARVAVGPGHLYAGAFPLSLSLPGL